MTLTNTSRLVLELKQTATVGAAAISAAISKNLELAVGDADVLLSIDAVTPADPFATAYDLADETLTDVLAQAVDLASIELLYFKNNSENALTLGGGAADIAALADGVAIPAGGEVLLCGSLAAGAGADQITVTGTAAGDAYELLVVGTAAA